jgi:hypothetical protein
MVFSTFCYVCDYRVSIVSDGARRLEDGKSKMIVIKGGGGGGYGDVLYCTYKPKYSALFAPATRKSLELLVV